MAIVLIGRREGAYLGRRVGTFGLFRGGRGRRLSLDDEWLAVARIQSTARACIYDIAAGALISWKSPGHSHSLRRHGPTAYCIGRLKMLDTMSPKNRIPKSLHDFHLFHHFMWSPGVLIFCSSGADCRCRPRFSSLCFCIRFDLVGKFQTYQMATGITRRMVIRLLDWWNRQPRPDCHEKSLS